MESCRKEDFSEASAVGEFRNFLNIGVAKVYTLEQSATVARMRSNGCEKLCEGECGDSRVGWDTYSFGVFFPRVRTPCGHGAQVIVEGRESQSDGGENNTDHKQKKQQNTKPKRPTGRVSTIM